MRRLIATLLCVLAINCAMAQQPTVGERYTDLNLTTINGDNASISELLAEGKWVLIDFWATWCGPCRHEIPYLVDAYQEFKAKGFEIYGISLCGTGREQTWKKYVNENDMTWINVWGYEGDKSYAAQKYGIRSIPSNFLVSPSGEIVATSLRGENIKKVLSEYIK